MHDGYAENMSYVEEKIDDILFMMYFGEIDLSTAPVLMEHLISASGRGYKKIAIDLEGVKFIDATILGTLVTFHREMKTRIGWRGLVIVCSHEHICKIFDITRLDTVLRLCHSREEALIFFG